MSFGCKPCGLEFRSLKGLNNHLQSCPILQEEESSLPSNALQRYQEKQVHKQRRLQEEEERERLQAELPDTRMECSDGGVEVRTYTFLR